MWAEKTKRAVTGVFSAAALLSSLAGCVSPDVGVFSRGGDEMIFALGSRVRLVMKPIPPLASEINKDSRSARPGRAGARRVFWMSKFEVTQDEWECVMRSNPSAYRGEDYPVTNVSWDDCQEFIRRLNARTAGWVFRMPTESEWEYACHAGTTTFYYTGDSHEGVEKAAWISRNSILPCGPRPVGRKIANAWGLYDMHGNVAEWCADEPHPGLRTIRGGSHLDSANTCGSAISRVSARGDRRTSIGFRLVVETEAGGRVPE